MSFPFIKPFAKSLLFHNHGRYPRYTLAENQSKKAHFVTSLLSGTFLMIFKQYKVPLRFQAIFGATGNFYFESLYTSQWMISSSKKSLLILYGFEVWQSSKREGRSIDIHLPSQVPVNTFQAVISVIYLEVLDHPGLFFECILCYLTKFFYEWLFSLKEGGTSMMQTPVICS